MHRDVLSRVGLLLLMLALIATGMPRWELHSHAHEGPVTGHAHDHGDELLRIDHQGAHPLEGDSADSMQPHLHEASSMFSSACPVEALIVAAPPPESWPVALDRDRVHTNPGPPPHRPPIA